MSVGRHKTRPLKSALKCKHSVKNETKSKISKFSYHINYYNNLSITGLRISFSLSIQCIWHGELGNEEEVDLTQIRRGRDLGLLRITTICNNKRFPACVLLQVQWLGWSIRNFENGSSESIMFINTIYFYKVIQRFFSRLRIRNRNFGRLTFFHKQWTRIVETGLSNFWKTN
jgi:hypothetical protein